MLILSVCGIIRSLNRVLLRFVLGVGLGKILIGMLYEYGVLGYILFICVGFIRIWVGRVVRYGG